MQFITLAQLARDLDFTEKKTRRILKRLIKSAKFERGIHYELDAYIDESHFTYLVDPVAFMREAHLEEQAKEAQNKRRSMGTNNSNQGEQSGTPSASQENPSGNHLASHKEPTGSPVATPLLPLANRSAQLTPLEARLLEDVDWYKDQISTKDSLLKEWEGFLPDYKSKVNALIEAKEQLARLGPGTPDTPKEGTTPAVEQEEGDKQEPETTEEETHEPAPQNEENSPVAA